MDQPSFFHASHSTRGGDGFLLGGVPSSLSGSAGTVSALPGELDLSLNDDTPQNNKPALSSIADIRRTSPYTSGNKPPPKTKMASDPCKPSEAMIKISMLVELPTVCEALSQRPKWLLRAFPFLSLQKAHIIIVKGMRRKISPPLSTGQRRWVKFLSTLSVGQFS